MKNKTKDESKTYRELMLNLVYDMAKLNCWRQSTVEETQLILRAVDKQILKKPKIVKSHSKNYTLVDFFCPECNTKIISKIDNQYLAGRKEKHCHECGQAIDWSEEY